MNEEPPIGLTDPFRTCRIAATVLSLLTAALVVAVSTDLVCRPTAGERSTAIRRMAAALPAPAVDMIGSDTRYGPMVPMALHEISTAGGREPWGNQP
ncbi:MAG: hypothetical protein ABIL58_13020 [Pseudomonadota bacterium]